MIVGQTLLSDPCPRCGKYELKLDEETGGKWSVTCYAWCGLGSARFRDKERAVAYVKRILNNVKPKRH